MKKIIYLLLFSLVFSLNAQQKELTLDDAVLGYYKGLYPESLRNLQWLKDKDVYFYQTNKEIIFKNTENQQVNKITKEDFTRVFTDRKRLPYVETATSDIIQFSGQNEVVLYDYNQKKYQKIKLPEGAENQDFCYQNKHVAFTLENNLYVANPDKSDIAVTNNKDKNIVSGQAIARSEFGITKGTFWSPKGNKLAFYQKDESNVDDYPLVDITVTPAKLHNIKYPMNGSGSEEPAVGVYDLKTGKTVYLKLFDKAGKEHYATNLSWGPDEKYIYLAEVNRDQNHMWFNKYDAQTGAFVKTLFEETNDKWVEPEYPAYFIPNGKNEFIYLSERDGFMNLYKYNNDGKLIKQLTHNKWVTDGVLGFSQKGKYVYITGTGTDPRDNKLFKVNTRNGKIKELSPETGQHYTQLSPSGKYFLDNYSNVYTPRMILLRNTAKEVEQLLLKAENPLADYKVNTQPEMFTITGEYGDKLYARMFKPVDFDPAKKYPVLVYVYGGPHAQLVTNRWLGGASMWMPWMTAQGYIVFTVDGHGSANRGFAFESVIHRHLGVVEMKDQLHGIDYLKSLPYVDADRIAVHGLEFRRIYDFVVDDHLPRSLYHRRSRRARNRLEMVRSDVR